MYRPQELELLACGGQQLDLEALESATIHDDGYTRESQVCLLCSPRSGTAVVLAYEGDQ